MYCSKCGSENKEGATFCFKCGNQFSQKANVLYIPFGFISAIISLFIFPPIFGILSIYCGYKAYEQGFKGFGIGVMVFGIIAMLFGMVFGIIYWTFMG